MSYVKENHKGTMRLIKLFECLFEESDGCTFSDIVSKMDVPKSTIFPMVHTLKDNHYLTFDEVTGRYSLGIKLFELGCKYTANRNYLDLIQKEMAAVTKKTGESCNFGIYVEGDVFYLLKEYSPNKVRMHVSVGNRLPAYSTAIGKALLSQFTEIGQLSEIYHKGLVKIGKNTITEMDDLFKEIQRIKETGYATEYEESTNDITCIAVPIYSHKKIVAAMSIATPIYRYTDEKRKEQMKILLDHKAQIEKMVQDVPIELWG